MADIEKINIALSNKCDLLLDKFNIKYYRNYNRLTCACPVHDGDNPNAFCLYTDGKYQQGNWKCWTNNCQEQYGSTMIGLIVGVLSRLQKKQIGLYTALNWAKEFLNDNTEDIVLTSKQNRRTIIQKDSWFKECSRSEMRNRLIIPASYYIRRGYYPQTLNFFDIGLYTTKGNPLYMRVVTPIYDNEGKNVIGVVGRTTQPKCSKCNLYHFENRKCPTNNLEIVWAQKWLHNKGFNKRLYLYNYWNAKDYIIKTKTVNIVEGPGDIWRLWEAGVFNSVGIFGVNLTQEQSDLLKVIGVETLNILTDNDKAGLEAKNKIREKYNHLYNINNITIGKKDIGEMSISEIKALKL